MIEDIAYSDLKIGAVAELSKTVCEDDVLNFANVSMDFNPIHFDDESVGATTFKRRIAHGMLSAAVISAVIGTVLPGKNTIYLGQTLRFSGPVFIGDTITARVEVLEKRDDKHIIRLKTEVYNQEGKIVIDGEASVMKK